MRVPEFSVNRPVTIVMAVLIVLILGFVSLTSLSIDLFPELNLPVAIVLTDYPGVGPLEMENLVTHPIEQIIGSVSGLKNMQSFSMVGSSMIMVEFEWGTDMNQATLDMREKIGIIKAYLPEEVTDPMVIKMDPNLMPIVQLTATSDMKQVDLMNILEDKVQPRLERIDGVASVVIAGGKTREIQVELDPTKLSYYGISINQVAQALQGDNLNLSSGKVSQGDKDFLVRITGEYQNTEEIGNVTITTAAGSLVRIRDLGQVVDGYKEVESYSRTNGEPSIGLMIRKQTHANTVKVSRAVRGVLADLQDELPGSIQIKNLWDQAEYIELSINNVVNNLIVGGILAVLILYVFLRNIRSTMVIGLAMPISIIATFIMVYFGGLSLNIMSLGGLALGMGMMVDNSIVILENIFRHRERGLDRKEAAIFGASEVTTAIIASTLTTIAVFFPIVFVQGIASQLFRQLALSVSFALVASLLVALTLIPMLASRMLKLNRLNSVGGVNGNGNGNGLDKNSLRYKMLAGWGRALQRLDAAYRKILEWSLKHRKRVVVIVTLVVLGSLALIPGIGAEFIPAMDEGYMTVDVTLPYGSKLEETEKFVYRIEQIIEQFPEVNLIASSVGTATGDLGGGMGMGDPENGHIDVFLTKLNERTRSTVEIADKVREKTKDIAGAEISVGVGDASSNMGMSMAPIEVVIKGSDLPVLTEIAGQIERIVKEVPGTREVENSFEEGRPEIQVSVNRQKAAQYGLNVAQIAGAARAGVQGQVVSRYRADGNEIDVKIILPKEARQNVADLQNLELLSPLGVKVPLKEVADLTTTQGPNSIERRNQIRSISVTSQIAGRDLNSILKDIQVQVDQLNIPDGYTIEYSGATKQMQDAFGDLLKALILAIVLVYMIMAAQFESLFHPFVIMFSMPVTIVGVILGLFLTGRTFNVVTFIGVIMLAGIVVNNAIVLVDYINILRLRGMERNEAILTAGPTRLRPILMTALTTILAMIPMALGYGEGGEARAPMATAVIGGLTTSTLLTLVLIPVVYSIFDDIGKRFRLRKERNATANGQMLNGQ